MADAGGCPRRARPTTGSITLEHVTPASALSQGPPADSQQVRTLCQALLVDSQQVRTLSQALLADSQPV